MKFATSKPTACRMAGAALMGTMIVASLSLEANAGPVGKGAAYGAAGGAVLGAVTGGSPLRGAAVGAATGAVVGAIVK